MDAPNELLYLSRSDVESLNIQPSEIIEVVEEAFREKAAGRVEMPPPGLHHTELRVLFEVEELIGLAESDLSGKQLPVASVSSKLSAPLF